MAAEPECSYRVDCEEGLHVTATYSRDSDLIGTLSKGETVGVLEDQMRIVEGRMRAPIRPNGWITLRMVDGANNFVVKAEVTGSSGLQRSIVYRTQGLEKKQEDSFVVADNLVEWDTGSWGFVGVFDGHGGSQVVGLVKDCLHTAIRTKLESTDVKDLLRKTLVAPKIELAAGSESACKLENSTALQMMKRYVFDPSFLEMDTTAAQRCTSGGTTVTVLLFWHPLDRSCNGKRVFVANVGDSSVVVVNSKDRKAFHLTRDHAPNYPLEEILASERGGKIIFSRGAKRLNGELVVSRSIGDHEGGSHVAGHSCEPDVLEYCPQHGDVIVGASDGLWDMLFLYLDSVTTRDIVELSKRPGLSPIQQNAIQAFSKTLVPAWLYDGEDDNDVQGLTDRELDMSWNREEFKALQGIGSDAGGKMYWDHLLVEPTRNRQVPDPKHAAPLEQVCGLIEYTSWSRDATKKLIDEHRLVLEDRIPVDGVSQRDNMIYYKVAVGPDQTPTVECRPTSSDAVYKIEVPSFLEVICADIKDLDDLRAKLESRDSEVIVNAIFSNSRKPTNCFFSVKLCDLIEEFHTQAMKAGSMTATNIQWDESGDGCPNSCGQEALKIALGVDAYKLTVSNGYENVQDNMVVAVVDPATFGNMEKHEDKVLEPSETCKV